MKKEIARKKPGTPDPIKMIYFNINNLDYSKYNTKPVNMPKLNQNFNPPQYNGHIRRKNDEIIKRPSTAPQKDKSSKKGTMNMTFKHNVQNPAMKRVPSPMLKSGFSGGLRRPLSNSQKLDPRKYRMPSPANKQPMNYNFDYFNNPGFK